MPRTDLDESRYRHEVDDAFARIDAAFEAVDPDVAESIVAQGALTVTFADGRRCILSPQTPVRQIWVAFRDRAWHLDLERETGLWKDDRGQGVELYSLVVSITRDAAGIALALTAPTRS